MQNTEVPYTIFYIVPISVMWWFCVCNCVFVPGGKGGHCMRLTTSPLYVPNVMKSGSLNLPEPSGPHRACNGTALPLSVSLSKFVTSSFFFCLCILFNSFLIHYTHFCLNKLPPAMPYCVKGMLIAGVLWSRKITFNINFHIPPTWKSVVYWPQTGTCRYVRLWVFHVEH
jgi:hypothetical protein